MTALGRVVRSGVGHGRVRTLVTGLAAMMAVTASILGGSLLVASSEPFERAFAGQHGAHLTAQFDATRATVAELTASARASGVTGASGPFPVTTITALLVADARPGVGDARPEATPWPMTVVGRADPSGPVDALTLTSGTWPTGPGQIVLSADQQGPPAGPGAVVTLPDLPGHPRLTVVGTARSVSGTADAWVVPSEISSISRNGTGSGYQMLYRFAAANTSAQVAAERAAVAAAVPAGALTGSRSWLDVKQGADRNTALFVPFLLAFGALGVVMSVLVVGNVVAGAVGAATRRIGILKALGFTPSQVVRAYVGQALVPTAVGTVLGVVAGNALAVPILSATNRLYGTNTSGVAPWMDVAVAAGALALAASTAWAAALRAGRLRSIDALAVGRGARPGRGRRAAQLIARLPLPSAVGLGLARPFARPARAASTAAAIVFGAAAVTFAIGIGASLGEIQAAKNHDTADVVVTTRSGPGGAVASTGGAGPTPGPTPGLSSADTAAITGAIGAQPGTRAYYGTGTTEVGVVGVTGSSTVHFFTGDASWAGYRMVSGSWFQGPGQAVVPTTFLTATDTRVGDTITLDDHGTAVPVRIVGEVLDPHTQTMEVLTDAATLSTAEPGRSATDYYVALRPGTSLPAFLATVNEALRPVAGVSARADGSTGTSGTIRALNALTAALTLMLVLTAALGVLNAVVLDTRDRIQEIGIHKALGMTPRQTVAMVLASVALIGLVGGAVGVPAGVALQSITVPAMGHSAGITLPASVVEVYHSGELVLLGLGGLVIAALGALLPAGWAARSRTATALRTE
ncbi:FtsX-like permease family protein [Kitasatospora sp. NBC_00315]|uniref:ABC transporter permease n=1 Tax=Kitasatospora sp. NBC_00315 TaxID=2975963 RepID=UPI00324F764C